MAWTGPWTLLRIAHNKQQLFPFTELTDSFLKYKNSLVQWWLGFRPPAACVESSDTTMVVGRVRLRPDGTRWRTGGEVKGKMANGVGSQYSHTTSERGVSTITYADAHTSAASSRLNWRPHRFKWTRPFRRKRKSGFGACAITFQTQSSRSDGRSVFSSLKCRSVHV